MGKGRLLLFSFFVYVVLDLGCPMIPGAFSFDPDASVEAVSAYRLRPATSARIVVFPATTPAVPLPTDPVRRVGISQVIRSTVDWRPHAAHDRARPSDPRPPVDHD